MVDNRKKYAPRKKDHKFYLSDSSRQLLEAESRRTSYPMSIIVDMLIQKHIEPERQDDTDKKEPDLFEGCSLEVPPDPPKQARPITRRRPS